MTFEEELKMSHRKPVTMHEFRDHVIRDSRRARARDGARARLGTAARCHDAGTASSPKTAKGAYSDME